MILPTISRLVGGGYAQHGEIVHRRIQGHLQRRHGLVFAGLEGDQIVPSDLVDCRFASPEQECEVNIGEGVIASALLDAVLGSDLNVCLEIKSGRNVKEAELWWLQLGLNSMIWAMDKGISVVGRLMYFYNTDHLYYLSGDGCEYWTYLRTLAWMACEIRDREESVGQITRSYNRSMSVRGQGKLFVAGKGESAEKLEYSEYLREQNFNQGNVMRNIKRLAIKGIMTEVRKVE